ncbi:MAG: alpha/beta fold hydrolase, partial [Bacteroidota bacterium]
MKKLLIVLLSMYVILCLGLYLGHEKIFFDPHPLSPGQKFRMGEEIDIEVDDGVRLNTVFVDHPSERGLILYFHGNRGNNRRCLRQLTSFANSGYDWMMVDYRGYGKSSGRITSQRQLYRDMMEVYRYALVRYRPEQIIIVGYSMGTGIASYVAAQQAPKEVVLVAPYLNFFQLKNKYLPIIPNFIIKYPLNNWKQVKAVDCPITIFHGTADEVIPYA